MLNRRMKKIFLISAALSGLFLSSCSSISAKHSATADIIAFAEALQNRNLSAINYYTNKANLKKQVMQIAREVVIEKGKEAINQNLNLNNNLGASVAAIYGADLLKPVIEALADKALEPENLASFARSAGLNSQVKMPNKLAASFAIKQLKDNIVCVPKPNSEQCLLYFVQTLDKSHWQLASIDENALKDKLKQFR